MSLKVKLQFEGYTNYATIFYKCSGKKLLPNAHQKMFFDIKGQTLYGQFKYHRFSQLGKPDMHKKTIVKSHSKK